MPKAIEVSVDEFVNKRSLVSKDGVVYRAAKMPKTFNSESRSATFVMTDETIDSYGDIVRAKGAKLDRFNDNPICLLNHKSDLVLGTWSDVRRIVRRIEGTATLADEGTAPHVDMAYNLMSQGILRGASIGFMPLKVERRLDDDGEPLWSYDILEWEMYECSVVSIPANPSALAKSMKDGCVLARDYLEEVLDTYVKTPSGVIMNIADVEAAYMKANGEKTAIVVRNEEDEVVAEETKEAEVETEDAVLEKSTDEIAPLLADDVIDAFASLVKGGDIVVLRDADELKLVIERSGEPVNELVLPVEMTVAQIRELQLKVSEKSVVDDKESFSIAVDTSEAEEKLAKLETRADSLIAKFARLFSAKSAETSEDVEVEQKAPPSAEEMEAALVKAAAVRERIASKGLLAA